MTETALLRHPRTAAIAAAVVLLFAPPLLSSFMLTLLTQALVYGILAMSLDLLLGYTGLPSLGHAAYFGVAAYVVAIGTTVHGWSFWLCLGVGIFAAAAVAAVFGLVAIRAVGVYFLMITLALGMVIWGLAFRWVSLTQGDNGIAGISRPVLAGDISISDSKPFYYACLVAFLLSFGLLSVIVRSPWPST